MSPGRGYAALAGGPLLVGHRGAAGLAPENTLASFLEAVEQWSVDMIETDVHASADGECVIIHDPTVDRTSDGTGPVADMTLEQLRDLDFGYRFTDARGAHPFQGQGIGIATLAEALESFPDTRFTLEVKACAAQAPMFETIRRMGATDRVVAAGMEDGERTLFGDFTGARSGSTSDARAFMILHRIRLARLWRPTCEVFQVPETHGPLRVVTPRFVQDAARHGVPVHVWTVDDPADMARLLDWGVDGIITDRPDLGRRVFDERVEPPLHRSRP